MGAIPHMTSDRERRECTARREALLDFFREQGWSFTETLRTITSFVYYTQSRRRKSTVAWLTELLVDLQDRSEYLLADPDLPDDNEGKA
jgi:hypothetical protein